MAGKYSVIIYKVNDEMSCDEEFVEVKRFNETSLNVARSIFNHHKDQLSWSQQHKLNMCIGKEVHGVVQLYDHREGFELEECWF